MQERQKEQQGGDKQDHPSIEKAHNIIEDKADVFDISLEKEKVVQFEETQQSRPPIKSFSSSPVSIDDRSIFDSS